VAAGSVDAGGVVAGVADDVEVEVDVEVDVDAGLVRGTCLFLVPELGSPPDRWRVARGVGDADSGPVLHALAPSASVTPTPASTRRAARCRCRKATGMHDSLVRAGERRRAGQIGAEACAQAPRSARRCQECAQVPGVAG